MKSIACTSIAECREAIETLRDGGATIGFVPTMGHLHAGHIALVRNAREHADHVVVSIFVNPLQFGDPADFETYPRDLDLDLAVCSREGVDVVFAPGAREVYPSDQDVRVVVGKLGGILEGAARPGHFEGVATVVCKLFHIIEPDIAVFGQKDAQQVAVIRRLIEDLAFPIILSVVPTVRDSDGLACSSRNVKLSDEERERALSLSRGLAEARKLVAAGVSDVECIEITMREAVERVGAKIDYATVVDPRTFERLPSVAGPAVAVVAARFGRTRLIDNIELMVDV